MCALTDKALPLLYFLIPYMRLKTGHIQTRVTERVCENMVCKGGWMDRLLTVSYSEYDIALLSMVSEFETTL